MFVRPFQLSDYAATTQLLRDKLVGDVYDETMDAFAKQLSWDSELVLIAENEQEIVGVIIGTIDNNKAYYYRVTVRDTADESVAESLITTLHQKFTVRKVSKVFVGMDDHNAAVLPLYERLGFSEFSHTLAKLSIVTG